jgi:NAD(P)-dependent dehydrogenase (short-subunit alcohol dehydrogenase family)
MHATPGMGHQAAVLALSQCLRGELAEHGIDVVAICPGFVRTNITSTARFVGATGH